MKIAEDNKKDIESALALKKEEVERVQEKQMQIEQQLRHTQTEIERF